MEVEQGIRRALVPAALLCSCALLLCSAALLLCSAVLCSALVASRSLRKPRLSRQAYKHTSIQAHKHTTRSTRSLLATCTCQYAQVYTETETCIYIYKYIHSTHSHTYTNVYGSQKQEWAFISPYENLYCTTCTTCTHLETKQHTSLPPSLPNKFLTFDCTFEYVYVFAFTLFKKS